MFLKPIQTIKNFTPLEWLIFLAALLISLTASFFLFVQLIEEKTGAVPVAGGEYVEGAIGQPSFINPILIGNNEVDRDLVRLVFDNLIELAENYKVSDNGKAWNVRLKEGLFWHDGYPLTSDDVIFTIKTIQDPDVNSPLSPNWEGITAERVSEREIKFILPAPYVFFESVLYELYPAPKHIFANIPAANLKLSNYNLEPIGSGKFKFVSAEKRRDGFITKYQLTRNDDYFGQKTYLEQFSFAFFSNESELINAFNSGKISGFGGVNPKELKNVKISRQVNNLRMPRYYAVFFNPSASPALKENNVRIALNYAVDQKKIIEKVFDNQAMAVSGPLVPGLANFKTNVYSEGKFSLEKARQILDDAGWRPPADGNIREKKIGKETVQLKFNLVTPDFPFLTETANLIKENWGSLGVELRLSVLPLSEINQEIIKTRDYEMILFGNNVGRSPDLFSFWHSSERFYPGLNLSLYENKTADNLIESIRKDFNENSRAQKLAALQSVIVDDRPAIFLYSPNYLYVTKKEIKGIEKKFISLASDRFENIEKWHIKTARVFK